MMKRHFNRILSACMALLLCVGLLGLPVSAANGAGYCGEEVAWTLKNGVLTISGTGAMDDYNDLYLPPWEGQVHLIQRVVVESGVTGIGKRAFYGAKNLKIVSMSDTVKNIGSLAFAECSNLTQISFPGLETLGWGCFYDCSSLITVSLPESLRTIGEKAFYRCSKLAGITIPAGVQEMGIMVFSYCSNLVYVNMKAPLAVLPNWTFYGCVLLWEVYLPSTIQTVETNALGECPSLYYVDYGGSQAVKDEIAYQLSQPTTMVPDESGSTDVSYSENENATVTVTNKDSSSSTSEGSSNTSIDASVNNQDGWEDVVEEVVVSVATGRQPSVNVQVQDDLTMEEGALEDLADTGVSVTVETPDNVSWEIVMKDQTADTISGSQDFQVSVAQNAENAYPDTLNGAVSYNVTLGKTSFYSTVKFPLGKETARKTATLYAVDDDGLRKLTSVIIDDDGMAAFRLAGTQAGKYVIGLDVPGIEKDEVIIPEKLAPEYGIDYTYGATLTDSQGNQYVLTGRVNKLGFGIGTLTLIVVGILVGSMILVGIVMMLWNKQQKQKYAQYRRRK